MLSDKRLTQVIQAKTAEPVLAVEAVDIRKASDTRCVACFVPADRRLADFCPGSTLARLINDDRMKAPQITEDELAELLND